MVSCFLTPDTATSQYTYPPSSRRRSRSSSASYMVDVRELPHGREGPAPRRDRGDDRASASGSPSTCSRRGRGISSSWSRWAPTASTTASGASRPGAPAATSPATRYEERDARLLPAPRREDRRAARASPTTTRRCSSSPTTARKRMDGGDLRQRVAAPRGLSRAQGGADEPDAPLTPRDDRLGADDAPGARAATTAGSSSTSRAASREGTVAAGRLRARARRAEGEARGARRRPGRPDRHASPTGPRTSTRSARDPARPPRLLRRPLLAQHRPGRRAAPSTSSRTTPAPTTRTTRTRGSTSSWPTVSGRPRAGARHQRRCADPARRPG